MILELPYDSAFKRVASKYHVVLGLRYPNPLSFSLLKAGAPSKNFHIKAKSSCSGPTAGFIPEEAKYSKVACSLYRKHEEEITIAKRKGAKAVPLVISSDRIQELIRRNVMKDLGNKGYSAVFPSGVHHFFIDSEGAVTNREGGVVRVMTNPPEYPPELGRLSASSGAVTADYDLFAIIPRKQQNYNLRQSGLTPRLIKGNWDISFLKTTSHLNIPADENKGNVHFFCETLIKALNEEVRLCGYRGGKLVWHGDETGNPYNNGFDPEDKPVFFLPQGKIVNVHSITELKHFYSTLQEQGYSPEYSPRLGV
ncbi:anthrax toxin-like adenylyl cyclase domain-containing protein [Enterobacter sp. 22466]|uniref:anthrax toxin-like adenylyl cyclase domain-containing protein n=1 Tax=Enterobacter sp. 22466 TaxID=3453924 RepID=UPI003F84B590